MKIDSIDLRGTLTPDGKPRALASITREPCDRTNPIEVDIIVAAGATPGQYPVTLNHLVDASDHDAIWAMATDLQQTLDGYTGTNSDIADYFNVLANFAE